jgi:hypothetical protein
MAWCISIDDSQNYQYFLNFAVKHSGLVLKKGKKIMETKVL